MAINDIVQQIQPPCKGCLFADDLTVFISCKDIALGEKILQDTVNKLLTWSSQNGLCFSTSKTTAVHFCRIRNCNHRLDISLDNVKIPTSNVVKYLGLFFDEKLNWKYHIDQLKSSSSKKLNIIKKLSHSSFGSDRTTLLKIYHTLIRSKIEYGLAIYNSANAKLLQSLAPIHHTAIRLSIGAFRTSPTVSILCEAGEPPNEIRRNTVMLNTFIRTQSNSLAPAFSSNLLPSSKSTVHTFHDQILSILDSIHVLPPSIHELSPAITPPWSNLDLNIELRLSKLSKKETSAAEFHRAFQEMVSCYPNFRKIYTDGSKFDSSTGCGIATSDSIILRYSLPSQFSILSAELFAIKLVIDQIASENTHSQYLICSDSLNAILCLQKFHETSQHPIAKEIIRALYSVKSSVVFAWVPSHIGIVGNELADTAAKEGAVLFPTPNIPIPPHDLRTFYHRKLNKLWQDQWTAVPTNNKLRQIRSSILPWSTVPFPTRKDDVVLTRLRLGHTFLTHSFLLKKEPPPICPTCNITYSVHHLLISCPIYQPHRQIINHPSSLPDILCDNPTTSNSLIQFLKQTKLYTKI